MVSRGNLFEFPLGVCNIAVIRDPSLFCYTTYFLVYLTNQFSSQLKKQGPDSQDFSLPPGQGHVRYRAGFTLARSLRDLWRALVFLY